MAASKKKTAWTDLLGTKPPAAAKETDAADEPQQPPVTVLMHTIVGNPENPRSEEDYTDDDPEFRELKASMKEIGQLQPLAVVSRGVYERAKPEVLTQARPKVREQLRKADWVVITGNRRLAAARQLGWTRVDIRVQDQLGDEEGRLDDAVIIENIHRKNIAPIKEAEFLKRMVEKYGSQDRVAERIGKSQMYVSHRLSLLKLAPDIQEQVDAGELKLKEARQLASRTEDHAEQRAQVAEIKRRAAEPKPRRKPETAPVQNPVLNPPVDGEETTPSAAVQNPVLNPSASGDEPASPAAVQNPVLNPPSRTGSAGAVPEPRAARGAGEVEPKREADLPHSGPSSIVEQLARMDEATFFETVRLLNQQARLRNAEMFRTMLKELETA
ncbi:ParB/RepB/Spo0J family partition protein [Streptomyces glaucosporus]|uniref:ParB/RepB/Spo0J family partition protein n=1 Tax=Streptomyces glaucosporus TaxID=284044 RepID=A0ABP5UYE8_9ACTN